MIYLCWFYSEEIRCLEPFLSSSFLELEDRALFGDLVPGLTEIRQTGDFGLLESVAGGGTLTFPRLARTSTSSRSPGLGTDTRLA